MSGVFEHIAAFDEGTRIAHRKAVAVARKRVLDRVGAFLSNATDQDRAARLALVQGDINDIVIEAAAEYGGDPAKIDAAVREAIGANESTPKVTLEKEARRPKMCPYHSELVDSSLQVGEPQYSAFSGLVGGPSHCKGGFDGTCNFKPEMVTQSYWDGKKQEYEENRQQREQEALHPPINPIPEAGEPTPPESEGQGITDLNTELEDAPSAIGVPEPEVAAPEMAMAAKTADADRDGGGAVKTVDLPNSENDSPTGLSSEPSPKTDHTTWKPNALNDSGNVKPIDTEQSGSPHPTEDQDVTTPADHTNDFLEQTDAVTEQQDLPSANDDGQSTERNIEQPATDTFNNDGQADPVGSGVMSNTQKIAVSIPFSANGNIDLPIKDLIKQNLPGFGDQTVRDYMPGGVQFTPTAAAQDPDKNPIRDILESEFVPESQVESALDQFKSTEKE